MILNCSSDHKPVKQNFVPGFALPTVLISSFIMLTVLLVSVASTAAIKAALVNQYYDQLARSASEAGLAYAQSCLYSSNNSPLWSDLKPLKPSTDCSGNLLSGLTCPNNTTDASCFVLIDGNVTSTFSVGMPTMVDGQVSSINSVGSANLLRNSDKLTWRTYNRVLKSNIKLSTGSLVNNSEGNVIISANKIIDTDLTSNGRSCADAVSYAVGNLSANSATLADTPTTPGCLRANDEILLINLKGTSSNYVNVGNYETLTVKTVVDKVVTFTSNKKKYYGTGVSDDVGIGTNLNTNQRVMLQRVPNYDSLTVNSGSTLTASGWLNASGMTGKGGVLVFRSYTTIVNGTVSMTGKGYNGGIGVTYPSSATGGESYNSSGGSGGGNGDSASRNGSSGNGGGGAGGTRNTTYGTSAAGGVGTGGGGGGGSGFSAISERGGGGGGGGNSGVGTGGYSGAVGYSGSGNTGGAGRSSTTARYGGGGGGGGTDGLSDSLGLSGRIYMGGAGGAGGGGFTEVSTQLANGLNGGAGGGIIILLSNSLTINSGGSITSNGSAGQTYTNLFQGGGGGGAGGSIFISSPSSILNNTGGVIHTNFGNGSSSSNYGGNGGIGRIALFSNSITAGTTIGSLSTNSATPFNSKLNYLNY